MIEITNYIEKSYKLVLKEGNEKQKTLFFNIGKNRVLPGQFYMINYKNCQKPFSVSYYDGEIIGFTIEERGPCSKKMIDAPIGSFFGLTGPLGSFFTYENIKKPLLIAGGIGIAPISFLAMELAKKCEKIDFLIGARNKIFLESSYRLQKISQIHLYLYTDDGSEGIKGFVTKDLDKFLTNNYDSLFMCGPELMMKYILEKTNSVISNIQLSMERYMKCGIGLCGSCVLDQIGLRVCKEGPVFDSKTILNCSEFGVYQRNKNGIIQKF